MERKFAFEKLDSVLAGGEAAWQLEPGEGQVSRAADSFLAILLSVTERYKYLAVSLCSEQEDPLVSNFCPILCTVDHLTGVLGTWAETPFFRLQCSPPCGKDLQNRWENSSLKSSSFQTGSIKQGQSNLT